jgi:hypothetical protein
MGLFRPVAGQLYFKNFEFNLPPHMLLLQPPIKPLQEPFYCHYIFSPSRNFEFYLLPARIILLAMSLSHDPQPSPTHLSTTCHYLTCRSHPVPCFLLISKLSDLGVHPWCFSQPAKQHRLTSSADNLVPAVILDHIPKWLQVLFSVCRWKPAKCRQHLFMLFSRTLFAQLKQFCQLPMN